MVVTSTDTPPGSSGSPVVSRWARLRPRSYQQFGIPVALLALVTVIAVFHPTFLAITSLANIGQQAAFYGIIALGMVFLLAMREIDLSVGGIYVLSVIFTAILVRDGLDPWLGAVVCVLVGVLLGAVNGVLANLLHIPVIIVTLGTLTAYSGLGLIISGSNSIAGQPIDNSFYQMLGGVYLRLPAVVWAFLLLTVVLSVLFTKTRFGFAVRAVGSNEEAARLSGYPIARIRLLTTMLVGGLCGISGVFTLAFFAAADPNLGTGYELLVIAAAIIGGTGLAGGSGSVVGALLGALIISVIGAGLTQFGVSAAWGNFVTGAVIVGAVALDAVVRMSHRRRMQSA